jgi:hypothetical protein
MVMTRYLLLTLLALSLTPASFAADVYKWVDDKGVVHFGHAPPPGAVEKGEAQAVSRGPVAHTKHVPRYGGEDPILCPDGPDGIYPCPNCYLDGPYYGAEEEPTYGPELWLFVW